MKSILFVVTYFIMLSANTYSQGNDLSFFYERYSVDKGMYDWKGNSFSLTFSSSHAFNSLIEYKKNNQVISYYRNGVWFFPKEKKKVSLIRLGRSLKIEVGSNLTGWIYFSINDDMTNLPLSPIFKVTKKSKHKLPYLKVFTNDENTPVYESGGIIRRNHFIRTGDLYIEYNKDHGMINTIKNSINSIYRVSSITCKKIKLNFDNLTIAKNINYKDVTYDFNIWPSRLIPLKRSIRQIMYDHTLKNSKVIKSKVFENLVLDSNIKRLVLGTRLSISRLSREDGVSFIHSLRRSTGPMAESYLTRRFSNIFKESIVFTTKLDQSKNAQKRKAYIPNENLNLDLISYVTLTKNKNNEYFFYFHSNGKFRHQIVLGPIDFKKLYWSDKIKNNKSCVERTAKYFSEYERKAFIFKANENLAEFSYDDVKELESYRKYPLDTFVLVNNCRAAGSFEYEWPGLLKGYFQLPQDIMNNILREFSNITLSELSTEVRYTDFYYNLYKNRSIKYNSLKDYLVSKWSIFKDENYKWINLDDFKNIKRLCKSHKLLNSLGINSGLLKEKSLMYEKGKIKYDNFSSETRKKSSEIGGGQPLSYIKTPCVKSLPMPVGFRSPLHMRSVPSKKYWSRKTCEWIPYQFKKYEDLLKYSVALSNFEVDGIYTGQNPFPHRFNVASKYRVLSRDNKARKEFRYDQIYSFTKVSYSVNDDRLNLIFSSKNGFSFVIGNVDLKNLINTSIRSTFKSQTRPWLMDRVKGITSLIGIYPLGLSNNYSKLESRTSEMFSFFFDESGDILNHHANNIGVEMWTLRYEENFLHLDLISHERIVPIAHIKFETKI